MIAELVRMNLAIIKGQGPWLKNQAMMGFSSVAPRSIKFSVKRPSEMLRIANNMIATNSQG